MLLRRFAALAFSLCLAASAFAASDIIRRGFKVADGGTLHLDAGTGSITIVSGGSGVAVEVVRKARGRHGDEQLREHEVEFEQNGNDVSIKGDFDHDWNHWFSDFDVEWNIRVPSRYNLDVKTSGGSIDLADVGGTVIARTSGGSIKTGRVSGQSTLTTSGGSISVDGSGAQVVARTSGGWIKIGDADGPVEARTSGGSITLARVNGQVLARTSGGSIRIEDATGSVDASTSGGSIHAALSRQPKNDSRLSTSGGGIVVSLAPGIGVELDAHASGGGVSSDVPITIQGTQGDDSLSGRINGGGPKLVLRSSGGGIHLRSAS